MLKNADTLAHAVKLLIGVAACAVDPTGVKVIGAAASGYLSLRNIFRSTEPEVPVYVSHGGAFVWDGGDSVIFEHIEDPEQFSGQEQVVP